MYPKCSIVLVGAKRVLATLLLGLVVWAGTAQCAGPDSAGKHILVREAESKGRPTKAASERASTGRPVELARRGPMTMAQAVADVPLAEFDPSRSEDEPPPPYESKISTRDPCPVVLTKGKDFLIHRFGRPDSSGVMISHVSLPSGNMKLVFTSGYHMAGTRAPQYYNQRLLGLAHDNHRLYLAVWSYSGSFSKRPPRDTFELAQDMAKSGVGGRYELQVFWMRDGAQICHRYFVANKTRETPTDWHPVPRSILDTIPEDQGAIPREILMVNRGPLVLSEGGISVFGVVLEFEGKKLVKFRLDAQEKETQKGR